MAHFTRALYGSTANLYVGAGRQPPGACKQRYNIPKDTEGLQTYKQQHENMPVKFEPRKSSKAPRAHTLQCDGLICITRMISSLPGNSTLHASKQASLHTDLLPACHHRSGPSQVLKMQTCATSPQQQTDVSQLDWTKKPLHSSLLCAAPSSVLQHCAAPRVLLMHLQPGQPHRSMLHSIHMHPTCSSCPHSTPIRCDSHCVQGITQTEDSLLQQ